MDRNNPDGHLNRLISKYSKK